MGVIYLSIYLYSTLSLSRTPSLHPAAQGPGLHPASLVTRWPGFGHNCLERERENYYTYPATQGSFRCCQDTP